MEPTEWSRKIDKMGRILLPVKLREKYRLVPGMECPFFIYEEDRRAFICFEVPPVSLQRIQEAKELLEKFGMKVVEDSDSKSDSESELKSE